MFTGSCPKPDYEAHSQQRGIRTSCFLRHATPSLESTICPELLRHHSQMNPKMWATVLVCEGPAQGWVFEQLSACHGGRIPAPCCKSWGLPARSYSWLVLRVVYTYSTPHSFHIKYSHYVVYSSILGRGRGGEYRKTGAAGLAADCSDSHVRIRRNIKATGLLEDN